MKVVIADPKNGKCYQTEIDETKSKLVHNTKIGDSVDGTVFGLEGFRLRITGGTDCDGFPMRPDVHGAERKKILLSAGPGFKPRERGERRKKTVRGNLVSTDIAQLNMRISIYGTKSIAEVFGKAEGGKEKKAGEKEEKIEEKKEEAPKGKTEEVKEEKQKEAQGEKEETAEAKKE